MITDKAFAKGITSLFIVDTPLQVMCAAEAIRIFGIQQYSIIFPCDPNENRKDQTVNMLSLYKLDYEEIDFHAYNAKHILIDIVRGKYKEKYERAFIGNAYDVFHHCLALAYLKKKGNIVYLDDGAATMRFFDNNYHIIKKTNTLILEKLLGVIAFFKNIKMFEYFFTLYYDYTTHKNVYPNNLTICSSIKKELSNEVFFIGTNSSVYVNSADLTMAQFVDSLKFCFDDLRKRHNECKLIYIPHGRDNNGEIKALCEKSNVEYRRLSQNIEIYITQLPSCPKAVAGFVSSALFNIRKISPDTDVVNYYPHNSSGVNVPSTLNICKYYENNGIEFIPLIYTEKERKSL